MSSLKQVRYVFDKEKNNPGIKGLIQRDGAKIDKCRQQTKESLLSMKRLYERTEEVVFA